MFSLKWRDQLQGATGDEFESLVAQIAGFLDVAHNEDGSLKEVSTTGGIIPVGGLVAFASNTVPRDWLLCDGSALDRVSNKTLFDVIGVAYGAPSALTFNLPDLRQRVPLGKAASGTGATLGDSGGALDHHHTGAAGAHTHTIGGSTGSGGAHTPAGSISGSTGSAGSHDHGASTGSESSHTHTFTTGVESNDAGVFSAASGPALTFAAFTHTHSGTTAGGSSHSHSVSSDGAHTHTVSATFTGTAVTDHTHTLPAATGSTSVSGDTGDAVGTPYLAVNYIIRAR